MRQHLISAFYAVVGAVAFFGLQQLVHDDTEKSDVAAQYLPADLGEKTVLWLESDGHGGLKLNWEKHQVLAFGMAQVPVSKD
jgi:hypothetical protein